MIAKVVLFLTAVAAAHATVIGSGLWGTGLINGGIVAPGMMGVKGLAVPTAVSTGSVVAIPGAVSTDKRIIGTSGLLTGAPLMNGLWGNGIVGAAPLAWGNGIVGAAPLAWGNGLVGPLGVKSAGIIAAPGMIKTMI